MSILKRTGRLKINLGGWCVFQDAEEVQLFETSSKSKLLKASIAVLEYQTPKEAKNIIDERIKPENCDGATTPTQKVLLRKQLQLADGESSGNSTLKSNPFFLDYDLSCKRPIRFTD